MRDLIRDRGFPPPKGFRRWRGELLTGAEAVCAASRWPLHAVEAWFAGSFPLHAAATADAEEAEWADRLDARAREVA